jgi:hypothetical protein
VKSDLSRNYFEEPFSRRIVGAVVGYGVKVEKGSTHEASVLLDFCGRSLAVWTGVNGLYA